MKSTARANLGILSTISALAIIFLPISVLGCSGVIVPSYPVPHKSLTTSQRKTSTEVVYNQRKEDDFMERSSRLSFARKVYAIFGTQMAATVAVTGILMSNYDLAYALLGSSRHLLVGAALSSYAILIALVGSPAIRHKFPINLILLGAYTFFQSIMIGMFSLHFNPKLICLGTVHTLVAFLAITLYSFQPNPNFDLTTKGTLLMMSGISLAVGSILGYFFKMPFMDNLISAALAVLFAGYIAYDTQMIVGGKHHKYAYGKNEYILAALNLYQDVINFFLQVMKILSKSKQRDEDE